MALGATAVNVNTGAIVATSLLDPAVTGGLPVVDTRDLLVSGEETRSRVTGTTSHVGMSTGVLRLAYFTARKSESITKLRMWSTTVAAAATPTLVRAGVYSVATNGDLSLVASIANDTTLFAATFTSYTRDLSAAWSKTSGQRYAFALLVVSSVATPNVPGAFCNPAGMTNGSDPLMGGKANGAQTDLPSSITAANVVGDTAIIFGEMLP